MLCTEYSRKQNRTRVERKTQGSDPARPVGQGKGFRHGLSLLKGLKHVLGLKKITLSGMWNRGFKTGSRENPLGFLFLILYIGCFCSCLLTTCSMVPKHIIITSRNLCNYTGISNVECIEFSNKIRYFVYSGATWKLLNLEESIMDKSCF